MLASTLTLARLAFVEALRQPIFLVTLVGGIFLLGLNPMFSAFTFGEDLRFLVDMGLATIFLGGVVLSAFTASSVVADELDSGAVLLILGKPIGRASYVAGKFLGIALALAVAHLTWSMLFLLTVRVGPLWTLHGGGSSSAGGPAPWLAAGSVFLATTVATLRHRLRGHGFTSTWVGLIAVLFTASVILCVALDQVSGKPPAPGPAPLSLAIVLILELQGVLILAGFAIAASTRLGQLPTLGLCMLLLVVGLSGRTLWGPPPEGFSLTGVIEILVPDLASFWIVEPLTSGREIPPEYLGFGLAYGLTYTAATLALAVVLLERREVGRARP